LIIKKVYIDQKDDSQLSSLALCIVLYLRATWFANFKYLQFKNYYLNVWY